MTMVLGFPEYPFRMKLKRVTGISLPELFEVWHRDVSDYDSSGCGHDYANLSHWRHWSIRVPALQQIRRSLFQRCSGCGGWSTRKNPVNVSMGGWDAPSVPWWWSRPNVYHGPCSTKQHRMIEAMIDSAEQRGARGEFSARFRKRRDGQD